MNLSKQILSGLIWSSIQLIVQQSFSFVVKIILAKLLFPSDFGLVGMAVVFTSFLQVLNDIGMGSALIQRKNEKLMPEHFHTSFWTGVVWSIFLYFFITTVVSAFAASFYNEPIMKEIIPILGIGVLASPINMVHKAQLTRSMNFKKIAIISNSSSFFSGTIAIIMAFGGWGIWALIFNSVASIVIAIPLYFKATKWKPKMVWSNSAFKDIFGFGVFTTGTSVFNNLISKSDYLLIGKLLSAAALGQYTFAFLLTEVARSQMTGVMNKVMYPIYGRSQDDIVSLKRYYLKTIRYNSLILYPIMTMMLLFCEPVIHFFFGSKWNESIAPIQILAVSVMFHIMVNSNTSLIRGLGKPGLEFKLQIFKALFLYLPFIYFGILYFGIIGAAFAVLINKILSVVIAQYFLRKLVGLTVQNLFFALRESMVTTIVAITLVYLVRWKFNISFFSGITIVTSVFVFSYWFFLRDELGAIFKRVIKFNK